MSKLVFLPDRNGRRDTAEGAGLIRQAADASELGAIADTLVLPPKTDKQQFDTAYRGALATALLLDSWKDAGVRLVVETVAASHSRFAAWVISSRPEEEKDDVLRLLLLEKDGKRALLGIVSRVQGLVLARQLGDLSDFLPKRVRWYDRETHMFSDPLQLLNEADCDLLLRRMHQMKLTGRETTAFRNALSQQLNAERSRMNDQEEDALREMRLRVQAALGMENVPGFTAYAEEYVEKSDNPLLRCFTEEAVCVSPALMDQKIWCYHGKPYARTSQLLGWSETHDEQEQETLQAVAQEIEGISSQLVWWHHELGQALDAYLRRRSDRALLPSVRQYLTLLKNEAEENSRQVQGIITLQYPLTEKLGASAALLEQALGDGWTAAAAHPFADALACMTGYQLGDQVLRNCCTLEDAQLLPPLSQEMAEQMLTQTDMLAMESFRYQLEEDGGITVSFVVHGRYDVRLRRTYAPEEQVFLAHPAQLAVYPCANMPFWHSYCVMRSEGEGDVSVWQDGAWQDMPQGAGWQTLVMETYPKCLLIKQEGKTLGVLPNLLPEEQKPSVQGGHAVASLDLGTSKTAVTLMLDGKQVSVAHRPLLRMLLLDAQQQMDDMLLSLAKASDTRASVWEIPTAVVLTGKGDVLGQDGYLYQPESLAALFAKEENRLLGGFKWRSDAPGVRARRLLLRQTMMETALSAVLQGAVTLSWRTAMEDDMGDNGRKAVLSEIEEGARAAKAASGLSEAGNESLLSCAGEAVALGTFLRVQGGLRGAFVALDLGAGSLRASLFLPSRTQPERMLSTPYGLQLALYETYQHHPERVQYDLGGCAAPGVQEACALLTEFVSANANTRMHVSKGCLLMERLLSEQAVPLSMHMNQCMNAGQVTYLQSAAIEYLCGALYIAGQLILDAQQDAHLSHYLPSNVTVALTGGGALLTNLLPAGMLANLTQLVSAGTGRVFAPGALEVQTMHDARQAVCRGVSLMKEIVDTQETPAVARKQSFSEQMLHLMQTIMIVAPMSGWLLHPGMCDQLGRMTVAGIDTVRRVAGRCYHPEEDVATQVMQFLSLMQKTTIEADELTSPGN